MLNAHSKQILQSSYEPYMKTITEEVYLEVFINWIRKKNQMLFIFSILNMKQKKFFSFLIFLNLLAKWVVIKKKKKRNKSYEFDWKVFIFWELQKK